MNDTSNGNGGQLAEMKDEIASLKEENETLKKEVRKAKSAIPQLEHLAVFNDVIKDVFSEIAHEINNPLNFVKSSISIIERGIHDFKELMSQYRQLEGFEEHPGYRELKKLEEEIDVSLTQKELSNALATINKGFERIQEVVYNLSLLGKQQEATPMKMDVNQAIEDTLFIIKGKLKDDIRIFTHLDKLPLVTSYRGKLGQVFINLFQNAIEAIREKDVTEGLIEIETKAFDDKVIIRVSDNGIGMSEDAKENLFEKFYTTKSPGKGTGLGMSVTKDIVEMHKGQISVASEREKGTTITIQLPIDH